MAKYKLSYFDMAGSRGEECRLALVLADQDFEDDRIAFADWQAHKTKTPFGSVPVLTVEGKGALCQSNAILNYIGTLYGLRPKDPFEAAKHDGVMDAVEEVRSKIWAALRTGQTDEEKQAAREVLAQEVIAPFATCLQDYISGPFVTGQKLQVADLKVWALCQWLTGGAIDHLSPEVLAPFKKLTEIHRAVAAEPKVAAFRAKHQK